MDETRYSVKKPARVLGCSIVPFARATIAGPSVEFNELLDRLSSALKSIRFEELTKYKGSKTLKQMVDDCIALLSTFKSYI